MVVQQVKKKGTPESAALVEQKNMCGGRQKKVNSFNQKQGNQQQGNRRSKFEFKAVLYDITWQSTFVGTSPQESYRKKHFPDYGVAQPGLSRLSTWTDEEDRINMFS